MANVIVGIPTGYIISRDTVEWMYRANFTGLERIQFRMQKLTTFFSHVSVDFSYYARHLTLSFIALLLYSVHHNSSRTATSFFFGKSGVRFT